MSKWTASARMVGASAIMVASVAFAIPGRALGDSNPNTYSLSAEADSLQVTVASPYLPAVSEVAASPWGASASLDSLGESMADSGAPYSPIVSSVPGTVNGLGAGQLPPLPNPPGYVSASYPANPASSQTQAGYQIAATTSSSSSHGEVNVGTEQPGSGHANIFASATATSNTDGSVTVSATGGADLLSLAGLADIGNVSSTEQLTEQAGHAPQITGGTNLGTITLLGLTSGLTGGAGHLLGVGVPIPITQSLITPLNTALAPGGVSFSYLPQTFVYTDGSQSTGSSADASKTVQSVDSGALQVRIAESPKGGEPVTVTVVLGRVYLSATDTTGFGPGTSDSNPALGGVLPSASPSGDTGAQIPASDSGISAGPGTSAGGVSLAPSANTAGGSAPSPVVAPPTAPLGSGSGGQQALPGLARAGHPGPSGQSFYLILVLAALAAIGASQLIRYVSVRLALSPSRPIYSGDRP